MAQKSGNTSGDRTRPSRAPRRGGARRPAIVIVLIAVLVLLVLAVVYFLSGRGEEQYSLRAAPVRDVVWNVPSGSVSDDELTDLKSSVTKDKFVNAGLPSVDVKVNVTSAKSSGEWTVLTGQLQNPSTGQPVMSELITVLQRGDGANAQVLTGFDPGFCGALRQVPQTLIPQGQRNYWVGCRG
jgi:hypothetical protein